MAPGHFGDKFGPHEHALHLGGLIGAAHPALIRMLVRPQGETPGSTADKSPVASRIIG